ncbi:Uncharacterised protein [Mycobacteroides abscessus]|nr:Uncharacterised protein [Mycobacteroides abscessus]
MDHINRFETKTTFGLLRAEYFVGMTVSGALLIWNISEVRWLPAILLFSYIDLVGYIPGVIPLFTRSGSRYRSTTTCSTTPCTVS